MVYDEFGLTECSSYAKKETEEKDCRRGLGDLYGTRLKAVMKKKHLVPYRLRRTEEQEPYKIYWSEYWKRWYTIMDMDGLMLTILWEDDKEETQIQKRKLWLNKEKDYELRPAEVLFNPVNTGRSITYAEIKALCSIGIIKPEAAELIWNRYVANKKIKFSDQVYYFIWSKKDKSGKPFVYIERDLEKSPKKPKVSPEDIIFMEHFGPLPFD